MSFLNALLRQQDPFFSLLEASAAESCEGVKELGLLLRSRAGEKTLEPVLDSRAKSRQITEEIDELLCQSSSAPLDSGDIELLSRSLNRISKAVRRFAERYQICARRVCGVSFEEQARLLEACVQTVREMVADLARGPRVGAAKKAHDTLQRLESEADGVFVSAMLGLYERRHDPMKTLMLKDLYELSEAAIDRCRTAGNLLLRITLKHS